MTRKKSDLEKLKISASQLATAIADTGHEEEIGEDILTIFAEGLANRLHFTDEQHAEFMAWALANYAEDES